MRPLAGYTVGVTAARRAEELGAALERRGARVLHGPAIRVVPLADDRDLLAATEALVARPADIVVATTAIGFRGWLEAAAGWGLDLVGALGRATVLTRGPKAKGAVRAAGLTEAWSPDSEAIAEVLEHMLAGGVRGKRVALQLHGDPLRDIVSTLRAAGADVVEVPVYRWTGPADPAPLDRLIDSVLVGEVHALTFTSAPAATNVLATAERSGRLDGLLTALRGPVLAAGVGAITAGPLVAWGVDVALPERARLGAMVKGLAEWLPARALLS